MRSREEGTMDKERLSARGAKSKVSEGQNGKEGRDALVCKN